MKKLLLIALVLVAGCAKESTISPVKKGIALEKPKPKPKPKCPTPPNGTVGCPVGTAD